MRKSKMLAKFRSGGVACVCGLGHYLPFFVRYAAHSNYDGIWLDLEHRAIGNREVQALLALCHHNDIDCMVRPPTLQRSRLYRYLEDGASGFMIPFVDTAEIARHVVRSTKFPPLGNRGVDGAGLDGDYGIEVWKPDSTYFEDANRETFIVAQIETPEAVRNVEEIVAIPGIDAAFIGPADLGQRFAITEGVEKVTIPEVARLVAEAARRHGKAWGIPVGSKEEMVRYLEMGAQLIPWGGDFGLVKVLQECSRDLDEVLGRNLL